MAYNAYDYTDIEDKTSSKYNAGILQTIRINDALKLINFCKVNPLAWNEEYCDWGYNLLWRSINNLYEEIDAFLDKEERKNCLILREKIEAMLKKYPILINKRKLNKVEKIPDEKRWEFIRMAMEHYERIVRRLGVNHDVISSIKEDDEGL